MTGKIQNVPTGTPVLSASLKIQAVIEKLEAEGVKDASILPSLREALKLLVNIDPYLEDHSMETPEILRGIIDETLKHDWRGAHESGKMKFYIEPAACAGTYEGNFIAQVARSIGAKTVLEIGMFTGTTTINIAASLPKDGKIIALESEAYLKEVTKPFFDKAGVASKIEVRIGQAIDSLKELIAKRMSFDLIFIDADKTGYLSYYEAIMDGGLLNDNGVLLVDNVLYQGLPIMPELRKEGEDEFMSKNGRALHHLNQIIDDDPRVDVTILPVRDGLSWVTKKKMQLY